MFRRSAPALLLLSSFFSGAARRTAARRADDPSAAAEAPQPAVPPANPHASVLLDASEAAAGRWSGFKDAALAAPIFARGAHQLPGAPMVGGPAPHVAAAPRAVAPRRQKAAPGRRPGTQLFGYLDGMSDGPSSVHSSYTHSEPLPSEGLREMEHYDPHGFAFEVKVPVGWAGSFEPTSINHMAHSWTSDVYSAQLKSDPSFHVVFKAMHIHDPKAKREMHMRRRLSDMGDLGLIRAGNIVPLLDSETSEDKLFFLFPQASSTLGEMLGTTRGKGPWVPGKPLLSAAEALPLMIDVLRGLRHLEEVGIVHADLTEDNILIIGGRAYIADLGTACLDHSGDTGYGCDSLNDEPGSFVGSAYRQAPEMASGRPTGYSNAVWSLGLVFARVALGRMPTEIEGPYTEKLDREEHGRKQIRRIISDEFRIEEMAGFDKMPPWTQELLSGMLAKNPAKRWTTADALEHATTVAHAMNMPLPDEPEQIRLPIGWFEEASWQ